ncbi:hypothetical protein BDV93DRAFT_510574 [Ceratobasidium sp. AG-I]|nr:hypothetical protein BDV93DRAFT_510574 [Ceratobasidium sp. AG-I]
MRTKLKIIKSISYLLASTRVLALHAVCEADLTVYFRTINHNGKVSHIRLKRNWQDDSSAKRLKLKSFKVRIDLMKLSTSNNIVGKVDEDCLVGKVARPIGHAKWHPGGDCAYGLDPSSGFLYHTLALGHTLSPCINELSKCTFNTNRHGRRLARYWTGLPAINRIKQVYLKSPVIGMRVFVQQIV